MKSLHQAFSEIVELPSEEQEAALARLELGTEQLDLLHAMLEADRSQASPIDQPLFRVAEHPAPTRASPEQLIGTHAGPFRIISVIGEGGSSFVFRAERAAGSGVQTVALKLLRAGLLSASATRRFRREHGILAQLDHPDIARLIDGGVTEAGTPYIAIEFVEGETITLAADRRALNLDARLRLFVRLCRAIDAAHAALIVHRDLKPSNVIVSKSGDLKVLDFGIAKLIAHDSDAPSTKTISLTPDYAAPEQFRGEYPTVAVDVFALGVLLRELLTGRRKPDGSLSASVLLSESLPRGLEERAALARRTSGDLDAIVAAATHREIAHRYRSADALAADVENHLAGLPVLVRRANRWYQVRRFIARHKLVVSVSASALLLIATSLAIAIWQSVAAQRAAERATAVRNLAIDVLGAAKASLPRDLRPTPEALVEQAALRLAAEKDLDVDTRVELQITLGEVWLSLSKFAEAEEAFRRALDHALRARDGDAVLKLRVLLAQTMQESGRNAEAGDLLRPLIGQLDDQSPAVRIRALSVLGDAESRLDHGDVALTYKREAARRTFDLHGADHRETLAALLEVGKVLTTMNRFAEAVDALQPPLNRWIALGYPRDNRYIEGLASLGVASNWLGFDARAEARARELLEAKRKIYPVPHLAIARSMRELAVIVDLRGKHDEAETLLDDALAMQRLLVGEDHVETLTTLSSLGILYSVQRRYTEAERSQRSVLATCSRTSLRDDVCIAARNSLGISLHREERLAEAVEELRSALDERRARYGLEHFTVAISMTRLANALADTGAADEALALADGSLKILSRQRSFNGRENAYAHMVAAKALERQGKHELALAHIDGVLFDPLLRGLEVDRRANMLVLKAGVLHELGRHDAMRSTLRELLELDVPPQDLWPATERRLRQLLVSAGLRTNNK
jgi:eukaryotic-like serine/threonine-protein kinase